MTAHRYRAFGLVFESANPISSLAGSELPLIGSPDVEIVEGEIRFPDAHQNIDGMEAQADGDDFFIYIENCGGFQITGGRRITVQPAQGAIPDELNQYLLGSVFGALLHQRRILPFHCNAVEIEGFAFLFCGDSGAGKSTLAAHFVDRGHRLLSDDVCALHFAEDGRLIAVPGIARLKLWQESLAAFGRSSNGSRRISGLDKFEFPLAGKVLAEPLPVAALYHLRLAEDGRPPGIHPVRGLAAANSVTANIYRRRLADLMGAAPSYLAVTARIVDKIPAFTMNRNWGFAHFHEEALAAEEHMRWLAREASTSIL